MDKKKKYEPDDPEQSERFIELAKEVGADESKRTLQRSNEADCESEATQGGKNIRLIDHGGGNFK